MDPALHQLYGLQQQVFRDLLLRQILHLLQHTGKNIFILQVIAAFKCDEIPSCRKINDHIKAVFILKLLHMINAVIAEKRSSLFQQIIDLIVILYRPVHCSQITSLRRIGGYYFICSCIPKAFMTVISADLLHKKMG